MMSNAHETKADLSDRKRVGAEDESREEQFEEATSNAGRPSDVEARRSEQTPQLDGRNIERANDLTTP